MKASFSWEIGKKKHASPNMHEKFLLQKRTKQRIKAFLKAYTK